MLTHVKSLRVFIDFSSINTTLWVILDMPNFVRLGLYNFEVKSNTI